MGKISNTAEEWARSIRTALSTKMVRAEQETKLTLTPTDPVTASEIIRFAADPAFVTETIKSFLDEYMLGPLGGEWSFYQQWEKRMKSEREHWLQFEKRVALSRASNDVDKRNKKDSSRNQQKRENREKQEAPTTRGFKEVWSTFSQSRVREQSGLYRFGIGPLGELMKLRSSAYSPFRSKNVSELDSLFLSTEFGTGIAANVGSPRFVRKEGKSKYEQDGERDGSWWLTSPNNVGDGTRVLGQKGFHFLYDARTREPHGGYMEYFRMEFPKYFVAQVAKRLQSQIG
jgi:hypothetical protein